MCHACCESQNETFSESHSGMGALSGFCLLSAIQSCTDQAANFSRIPRGHGRSHHIALPISECLCVTLAQRAKLETFSESHPVIGGSFDFVFPSAIQSYSDLKHLPSASRPWARPPTRVSECQAVTRGLLRVILAECHTVMPH